MGSERLLQDKIILIVDDEPGVLDTIAELLDMCKIHKARDYDTALQLLADYKFFNKRFGPDWKERDAFFKAFENELKASPEESS